MKIIFIISHQDLYYITKDSKSKSTKKYYTFWPIVGFGKMLPFWSNIWPNSITNPKPYTYSFLHLHGSHLDLQDTKLLYGASFQVCICLSLMPQSQGCSWLSVAPAIILMLSLLALPQIKQKPRSNIYDKTNSHEIIQP